MTTNINHVKPQSSFFIKTNNKSNECNRNHITNITVNNSSQSIIKKDHYHHNTSTVTQQKSADTILSVRLNVPDAKSVNRKVSFKIKPSSIAHKQKIDTNQTSRMYITTLSVNRVQELTQKFNQMCNNNTNDTNTKHLKFNRHSINSIIHANNFLKETSAQTKIKVKKKPSVKRKPSFVKVNTTKNIMDTIKLFEQQVPSQQTKNRTESKLYSSIVKKPLKDKSSPKLEDCNTNQINIQSFNNKCSIDKGNQILESSATTNFENTTTDTHKTTIRILTTPNDQNQSLKYRSVDTATDDSTLNKCKQTETPNNDHNTTNIFNNSVTINIENIAINDEAVNLQNITSSDNTKANKSTTINDPTNITIANATNNHNITKNTYAIEQRSIIPNTSFLWRSKLTDQYETIYPKDTKTIVDNEISKITPEDIKLVDDTASIISSESYVRKYETMIAKTDAIISQFKKQMVLEIAQSKQCDTDSIHSYDNCSDTYENNYELVEKNLDDDQSLYEQIGTTSNSPTKSDEPPEVDVETLAEAIKRNSLNTNSSSSDSNYNQSNLYESIYIGDRLSTRDSILSHDQQSNSLYGGRFVSDGNVGSDISVSDKSDDWIDINVEHESEQISSPTDSPALIIIHERTPTKKSDKSWCDKVRSQREKNKANSVDSLDDDFESDHLYESVSSNEQEASEYEDDPTDSFDSDSDLEHIDNIEPINSKFDSCELPPTPETNSGISLSQLANRAGKQMQRLKKNWFLTKNDLTKSLGRITKKRSSQTEIKIDTKSLHNESPTPSPLSSSFSPKSVPFYENTSLPIPNDTVENTKINFRKLSNVTDVKETENRISIASNSGDSSSTTTTGGEQQRRKKKHWSVTSRFKRSISLSGEMLTANVLQAASRMSLAAEIKPQSTFYLSDLDNENSSNENKNTPEGVLKNDKKSSSSSPIDTKSQKKNRLSSSSWYTDNEIYMENKSKSNTCWYAEIGLYPKTESEYSDSSKTIYHDSSDSFSSSTYSTGTFQTQQPPLSELSENTLDENYYNLANRQKYVRITDAQMIQQPATTDTKSNEDLQLTFQDEPLYQFYTAEKIESGMRDARRAQETDDNSSIHGSTKPTCDDSDDDGYEQIGEGPKERRQRPSAMQLIRPSSPGHTRTLWCEVSQVITSNLLNILSLQQKKLQEAKFELITSEASYLNSLNVLCSHFKNTILNEVVLNEDDRNILFGNIEPVKKCAENLLADLENCWQDNILLHGICDILMKHATDHFSVYITYCENQIYIEQILRRLKEQNSQFIDVLSRLESSPVCQSLPLHSFLMLPMQRITRLPLLLDAILKRLTPNDDEYEICQLALATVNKVVEQCNEGARSVEQRDEFRRTWSKLEFPASVPVVNFETCRLIRSGEVIQLISRGDDAKLTFGRKFIKLQLHLFLFTDLFIVGKRRTSDDLFNVIHYCPRNFIEVQSNESIQIPLKDATGKHLLFLTILENQDGKTIEMLFSCNTATDKERWYEAFLPPTSENPDEILYESWDCPQVMVMHPYSPQQPDELPLEPGDVVNVTRKMADGWYLGQRIRDGRNGWFPGNHVTEVASPHVRAKNLRQRYRLLALSRNFLESQRKKM